MATTATVATVTSVAPPANVPPEEEAAKKKNTDCVYFLASPLTCKKGDDCEFRHSESARLNPRDCWYWVGGNCLNRDCPFRHPPLDTRAAPPQTPSHPKKPVPCYFYSQGCCAKGSKCQYLHGGGQQHDNVAASPMVYRLSDSSKTSEANKSKPDSSITDAEATKECERKKDPAPKKAKPAPTAARETSESGTESQGEQQHGFRQGGRTLKQHKESYTWSRTEHGTPSKQPAKQEQGERISRPSVERKRVTPQKAASSNNNSNSSRNSREGKSQQEGASKGKRKLELGEEGSEQEHAKRMMSNGSAGTSGLEGEAPQPGSVAAIADRVEAREHEVIAKQAARAVEEAQGTQWSVEDDEDFARKLS